MLLFQTLVSLLILVLSCVLTVQSTCLLKYDPVVFSVAMTTRKSVVDGEIIKYEQVFANDGGAYDVNTGIFTSPEDGLYSFSINGVSPSNSELFLSIYHNFNQVISIYGHFTSFYASGSNTVILKLKKNDYVYVKSRRNSVLYAHTAQTHATFSGYKLTFG